MRKLRSMSVAGVAVTLSAAALITASPAAAVTVGPSPEPGEVVALGPGEWDNVGTKSVYRVGELYYTDPVNSGGGDFMACPNGDSGGSYLIGIYEYDPVNPDDSVGYTTIATDQCIVVRGISGFRDGDNNKAEFYIATRKTGIESVTYYD